MIISLYFRQLEVEEQETDVAAVVAHHAHAISGDDCEDCTSDCCFENDKPYQLKLDYSSSKRKQGKQMRIFRYEWYKDHSWLSYCVPRSKVFCFYCRVASSKGFLTFSSKREQAFTDTGFNNWKKAKQRFQEHEQCQAHKEAVLKVSALQQPSVASLLSHQLEQDQTKNRQMFMKLLSSLKFLVYQGLALRGHTEEDGNLIQLLKCRCEDIPGLEEWLCRSQYLSHDIVNELVTYMAHQLLRQLLSDIRSANQFALIVDKTMDMSRVEQLGISLRWVDDDYNVHEDLIGLFEVEVTDAATLSSTIKDTLIRCNLDLAQCCGQAYDGASNMSGQLNGIAARIQREELKALYVHCMAHCLNLCLQDCSRKCSCIRDALDVTNDIAVLISASPKRLALFKRLQAEMNQSSTPKLKPLCPTRWTVPTGALDAVLKNYQVICRDLETLSSESNGEAARKASGTLALLNKFSTYFGLKLSFLVFSATEQVSKALQGSSVTAQEATFAVRQAVCYLKRQQKDESFQLFYAGVVEASTDLTQSPVLPRQRNLPRRYSDGAPNHQFQSPEEFIRKQYFEELDILLSELDRRFNQSTFDVLQEIESLLVQSCNGQIVQPSEELKKLYSSNVMFDHLIVQTAMLPDLLQTSNEKHQFGVTKVTSINTVCALLRTNAINKSMFNEVSNLLRIYLTVPMTSAMVERTFSTLRRLKNYLRTTMSQKRLHHLALLHTHKLRTEAINLKDVAKQLADRRQKYFGNF